MDSTLLIVNIFPIIGLCIGLVGGALAGRNLIYWKLNQTNLAGEEEEMEGEYKDRQDLGKLFIWGGILSLFIGVICVSVGGAFGVDNSLQLMKKTECLITALVFFGLGVYAILVGMGKRKQ